ncbi:aldo/keto reductase [Aquipuribacter sp. SD81]|uniref:aldo/keto reductase n=1 Tax=Aquipuribacter sp. SD81 TaxID=3127703 RepID=UPI003018468B
MQRRRFGRTGFDGSVLVYGAAMLSDVDQDTADASVQEAFDAGITSFDTAASYGASEERLRPWADRLSSPDVFLATKVEERGYEAAWASIERSLARLGVDRVDLLQVHAVGETEVLDQVTGPRSATSGALGAVLRAQTEGLTRFVGITGHGHAAPAVHREALRRHDFDTVLSPWNHLLARRPDYAAEFHGLVADCEARDVGLRTIKTVSRRLWPDGAEHTYTTWYEPWDDPEHVDAAVAFALAEPGVAAIASPGDVRLLGATVRAVERAGTPAALDADDVDRVLSGAAGYASPFASALDGR